MQNPPQAALLLYFGIILFWVMAVIVLVILGRRWERMFLFGARMRRQWRPALAITVVYLVSAYLGGRGFNFYGIAVFCQAWIGLALAREIPDFEPLPLIDAFLRRVGTAKAFLRLMVFGILAGIVGMIVGSLAMEIPQRIFHEEVLTQQILQEFPTSKSQAFFLFLAGGGIAEELVHRFVLLSLVWVLTRRPWLAIFVAALIHSAYHFTPLNLLYLHFLQFPISQFVSGVAMGILWGYVFLKYGFEAAALGHTLSDWIPLWFLT